MEYKKWGGGVESLDKVMHTSGLNFYMTALPAVGMAKSGLRGAIDSVDAFWWNQGGYETMGNAVGEMGAQGAEVASMAVFGYETARKMGSVHGYKMSKGYGPWTPGAHAVGAGQMPRPEKFGKGVFGTGLFKKSSMTEGLITNGGKGRFIKPWGIGKSIGMFAGFAVAGAVFQGAASMTGRALDTMLQDTKGQRQLTYDNRFFSGQAKYDRGSYDQFGQSEPGSGFKMQDAMNEYSSKMMSMARVYHSM